MDRTNNSPEAKFVYDMYKKVIDTWTEKVWVVHLFDTLTRPAKAEFNGAVMAMGSEFFIAWKERFKAISVHEWYLNEIQSFFRFVEVQLWLDCSRFAP